MKSDEAFLLIVFCLRFTRALIPREKKFLVDCTAMYRCFQLVHRNFFATQMIITCCEIG